jgi:hypothetical protein
VKEVLSLFTFGIRALCFVVFVIVFVASQAVTQLSIVHT